VDLVEESVPLRGAALQVLRPRDAEALLDERAFEHEEYLPYWAELWPSGVALARRVAARTLKGARVLELGCGLGLPSLAAALAGGRVLATDWSPQAIDLLHENAARNDAELETAIVDWQHPAAIVERAPWDLVLGADLLYERRNVAPLLALLPGLLGPSVSGDEASGRGSGELWLADPGRAPASEFLAEFECRAEETDGPVTVYRLRPA
jgi:SAM-dependent methyltransferase